MYTCFALRVNMLSDWPVNKSLGPCHVRSGPRPNPFGNLKKKKGSKHTEYIELSIAQCVLTKRGEKGLDRKSWRCLHLRWDSNPLSRGLRGPRGSIAASGLVHASARICSDFGKSKTGFGVLPFRFKACVFVF